MDTSSLEQALPQTPSAGSIGIFMIVYFAVIALMIFSMWKVYAKAGKPGWAAIVPIYNIIVLLEIIGQPTWWFVMLLIPFVNIYFMFKIGIQLAQSFGKTTGFGIGLIFLSFIFFPMLGFGDAKYRGPVGSGATAMA